LLFAICLQARNSAAIRRTGGEDQAFRSEMGFLQWFLRSLMSEF
jgi:hypothetical protein